MHQITEFGVDVHFDYKIGRTGIAAPLLPALDSDDVLGSSSVTTEVSFISDERVESNEACKSRYISVLDNARQTLVQSNVFVFLPGLSSALEEEQLLSSITLKLMLITSRFGEMGN
jgi:(p)ppGpp synthase/HD superfamily hydrolase